MKIFPSLISSDLLNIRHTLQRLDAHCDGYHLDVMDDHFVPNLTWGPAFINAIALATRRPLQVHLMVDTPEKWIDRLILSGKDSFVFHIEALREVGDVAKLLKEIKKKEVKAGVALNPKTPVEHVIDVLPLVDELLIMSVEPGFSGQKFIDVTEKVSILCALQKKLNVDFEICMDGGIGADNIGMLAKKGVDLVGIASAIFSEDDPVEALKNLYACLKQEK